MTHRHTRGYSYACTHCWLAEVASAKVKRAVAFPRCRSLPESANLYKDHGHPEGIVSNVRVGARIGTARHRQIRKWYARQRGRVGHTLLHKCCTRAVGSGQRRAADRACGAVRFGTYTRPWPIQRVLRSPMAELRGCIPPELGTLCVWHVVREFVDKGVVRPIHFHVAASPTDSMYVLNCKMDRD